MNQQNTLLNIMSDLANDQEKVKALDELFANSAKYKKSAEFLALLEFINKFPNLSPFNAFLIHMQNSAAEVVLNPSKWREYGRGVNPLAKPYIILIPFGPVEFVYNISDTYLIKPGVDNTPAELINPFTTVGDLNSKIYQYTKHNAGKEGIQCAEEPMQMGGAGYAVRRDGSVFWVKVNSNYNLNEKYSTLIHELAHIYCGHQGSIMERWWESRTGLSLEIKEIEAESISYLVCNRHGLKTTAMQYLSSYIKEGKPLPNISMDLILTVSNHIEKMGEKGFKPKKK